MRYSVKLKSRPQIQLHKLQFGDVFRYKNLILIKCKAGELYQCKSNANATSTGGTLHYIPESEMVEVMDGEFKEV